MTGMGEGGKNESDKDHKTEQKRLDVLKKDKNTSLICGSVHVFVLMRD